MIIAIVKNGGLFALCSAIDGDGVAVLQGDVPRIGGDRFYKKSIELSGEAAMQAKEQANEKQVAHSYGG